MAYAIDQDNYRSKRSYVSTGPFNSAIYTYTSALNPTTFRQEGRLALVTASPSGVALTAVNCPAGRILRENGRRLYPSANPGLLSGDSFQGVANFQGNTEAANHFWVGVFDAVTGVKGFINPNASTFNVFNSDKSLEVVDVYETNGTGVTGGRFPLRTVTASAVTTALTLTAAQTVNGVVSQAPGSGALAVNLPSTATILAAMGGTVGATAEFVYINTSGTNSAVITAGDASTTLVGSATVALTTSGRFIVTVATATTVILYRA